MAPAARITMVEIQWPSGLKQEFNHVAVDAFYTVQEGRNFEKTLTLPSPEGSTSGP